MSTINIDGLELDAQHAVHIDANQIHGTIDGVPVLVARHHDMGSEEITWRATVYAGTGDSYTAVVNSRDDAEVVVGALAHKAKQLSEVRRRLEELKHDLGRMAGEITRKATDARHPEDDDEPPF